MRRILIGGSYVGAVAAGAVASAQLWIHAFTVDERSAIRELALPGTQERSVPALIEPARPGVARSPVSPSPLSGFIPIFASNGSGSVGGGIPVAAPADGGGGGVPAPPGSPVPGSPVPGQPAAGGASTPSGTSTASGQAPTASAAAAPPTSNPRGTTKPAKAKARSSHARAVPAVPAQSAQPPAARPATPATPAVPPGHAKPAKAKPEKSKPGKPPKNDTSSAPAASNPSDHGNGGGNGQGNGKGNGKK